MDLVVVVSGGREGEEWSSKSDALLDPMKVNLFSTRLWKKERTFLSESDLNSLEAFFLSFAIEIEDES